MAIPDLHHHPLSRADGSATYTTALHSVLAAVNGPLEVQRRDELPAEAAIEVNIRPGSGVGGPRERWLESVLHAVLRSVVLVHLHPRTLLQVTLQILQELPEDGGKGVRVPREVRDVAVLPALLNAAFLALVDGGVPLDGAFSAALAVVGRGEGGAVVLRPGSAKEVVGCGSVHAMAFTQRGEMLMDQSAGAFGVEEWGEVEEVLRTACVGALATRESSGDEGMVNGSAEEVEPWVRQALEERVNEGNAWRDGG